MLTLTSAVRIYLWTEPVDMRRGFDGLSAMVRAAGHDVFSGHLFVFVSRRADRAKILTWDRGGLILWYKRLSRGTFRVASKKDKPLCARSPGGLELHAAVHVRAGDRAGLERLCRYIARPPVPEQRLSRLEDGRYEWRLKRTWKSGVRAFIYQPLDLIARLAALIPLPMTKLRRFHGVFAPAHRWRASVVPTPPDAATAKRPIAPRRPATMAWADLLKRVWNIDGLRCLKCSGRMLVVGVVRDPDVVEAILATILISKELSATASGPRGPPDRLV